MIEYLENKRADNLKELLNLFENELHQNAQMQALNDIQANQAQLKSQMAGIAMMNAGRSVGNSI